MNNPHVSCNVIETDLSNGEQKVTPVPCSNNGRATIEWLSQLPFKKVDSFLTGVGSTGYIKDSIDDLSEPTIWKDKHGRLVLSIPVDSVFTDNQGRELERDNRTLHIFQRYTDPSSILVVSSSDELWCEPVGESQMNDINGLLSGKKKDIEYQNSYIIMRK